MSKKLSKAEPLTFSTESDDDYCVGCEFVKIMSETGKGYCQVHGDIDTGEGDGKEV